MHATLFNRENCLRSTAGTFAAVLLSLGLIGCASASVRPTSKTEFALDTACTISIYGTAPAGTLDKAFALLNNVGARMTIDEPTGELVNVNDAAGTSPTHVDPELFHVIQVGLRFSRMTKGAFDITIGPLTKLWGIGTGGTTVPSKEQIRRALSLVDYRDVVLNAADDTVYLKRRGMVVDLGAVAKGYAGDRLRSFLEQVGVHHAIVDLGGNVVAIGSKPDGSAWRVGIQAPDLARGSYMGVISVRNEAVVSSGQYERFITVNGKNYGHVLSTTTGYPVDNGIVGTTIVTASSIDADALSTAVFALGVKKGLALVNSLPGVEAVILTADKQVYISNGIGSSFHITDPAYTMARQIDVPTG